jgi:UDP-2-acetamido-3-amino-2,3-dideoxy-glucuronate N-acetyltransferase
VSAYAVTIHQPSQVHDTVRLGEGTVVWPFATILEGVQCGAHCVIGTSVFLGRRCVLGDDVHLHPGAALPNDTHVGNRVYIGPNVVLCNDAYPRVGAPTQPHDPPVIADDVILGANCVLLPGVRIGAGAIVGAGAVVTHDVSPGITVVGNPARRLWAMVERPLAPEETWGT